MVVGGAPNLSDRDSAESTGKTDIGKSSTVTGIRGVDTSLVAVYCRQTLGYLARALDAPAGEAKSFTPVLVVYDSDPVGVSFDPDSIPVRTEPYYDASAKNTEGILNSTPRSDTVNSFLMIFY